MVSARRRIRIGATPGAALVYAALALAFVSPALAPGKVLSGSDQLWTQTPWQAEKPAGVGVFGSNLDLRDAAIQFQPFTQYARERLPEAPLWNPYVMGGRPFVGNAQSAVFSPFSLPAYVLPFWSSLAISAALKLFVAAFGTFLLARALGMRPGSALLAGAVFGFGLYTVTWLSWPHSSAWALMPWVLLMTERVASRPGVLSVAGLAAAVGLELLSGHPGSSFHVMAVAVVFLGVRLARARRDGATARGLGPPLGAFAAALALGTALAAVAVVPFLDLLRASTPDPGTDEGLAFRTLVTLFLPDFWGRPTQTSLGGFFFAAAYYAGALPLLLAPAALILRPTLERVVLACLGALSLAVTVGVPPFFQALIALPGFASINNARLPIVFLLCVALLAGFGLDELAGRVPEDRRRRAILAIATGVALAPLAWLAAGRPGPSELVTALGVAFALAEPPPASDPDARDVIRLASLCLWLTMAGAGLLLLALRLRRGLAAGAFAAAAVTLVVVDLFRAGVGYNPAIEREDALQPATGAIRHLQERRPLRFAGLGDGAIPGNVAMRYGIYDARGYDFPVERRYDRLWARVQPESPARAGFPHYPRVVPKLEPERVRALRLLSVADIVQPPRDAPVRFPGMRVAYDGEDARVYEDPAALPRAFVVHGQRAVAGAEAALEGVLDPGFDARRAVVVERPLPGVPRSEGPIGPEASITTYEPERVALSATAGRRGVLVLTDVHAPGWRATVDGRAVPIERVDYLLRGVQLPAGTHRVELRYEPPSWLLARVLTIGALGVLALLVALGARRRARAPSPSS